MVWHNFGHALLFFVLAAICVAIGFIALIVGLLVAVPVVVFGAAYTYRRLEGLPVGPPRRGRRARGAGTASAPASRSACAATVRVQPVTTWSSTSSTGPAGTRPRAGSVG